MSARLRPNIGSMSTHTEAVVSSATASLAPTTLVFTDAAAAKVSELIREEANPNLKLRVFVQGGGCSGFQYGFTFDENSEEGDTRVDNQGVTLLIDPMSIQYLAGAEIDYREDIEGSQFVIRNPNATTTCGCGSSFAA
jgi:iron-sulfur cluster insertion protein